MSDEREFRIGDVQMGRGAERRSASAGGTLDAQAFPALSALLGSAEYGKTLDALAGEARASADPEVQAALKAAVRLLPVLKKRFGG